MSPRTPRSLATRVALVALALAAVRASADDGVTLARGHIRLGGEVRGAFAPRDTGFFNYTDYGRSTLRVFRLALDVEADAGPHVALVGEIRSDNLDPPRPYALYLRLRPFTSHAFDVQVGRIPPVFGAYARRRYSLDNPLPGTPLAYQYLTTLRPDAVAASAHDLQARQGGGWRVSYPIGSQDVTTGLPLVNGERWDVGAQVKVGSGPVELAAAVTQGTLCHPLTSDDNDGKQLSGRLGLKPSAALALGVSAARGDYLSREVVDALPLAARERAYRQSALGMDAEYSAGYWIVRAEAVWSGWDAPPLLGTSTDRLDALALMLEVRYKIAPGLYLAGRAEHLGFRSLETADASFPWDAPVTRYEIGAGYSVRRYLLLKASFQHNSRDGGRVRRRDLVAGQAVLWF